MNPIRIIIVLILAAIAARSAVASPTDALLDGVDALATSGNPASMVVWGDAHPLVASPDGRVFAAAGRLGRGRVVVLGHGGFLQTKDHDSDVFAANAVAWLGERSRPPYRIFGLTEVLSEALSVREFDFAAVDGEVRRLDFDAVDVVIGSPQAFERAGRLADLDRWIRAGGGMLITETAWGQLQLNPGLTLDALAANRLLAPVGVRFTDAANSAYGSEGRYKVNRSLLATSNADEALRVVLGESQGDVASASRILGDALASVPLSSGLVRRASAAASSRRAELDEAYRFIADDPLRPERDPFARAMIDLESREALEASPGAVRAHPSAASFPGPLGDGPRETIDVVLESKIPGWRTTGAYAPPGEVVRVTLPKSLVNAGVWIQIGVWRDPHDHPHRARLPDAIRRFPVEQVTTPIASAIGGPIYIDLPTDIAERMDGGDDHGTVRGAIRGAIRAPHFRLGHTSVEAWNDAIRSYGAPWAEFESDELVLTVPSEAVRDVERPDLVMEHWDRVHRTMQSMEPRTSNHWADRQYRYVADVSVSWGYMYCPADGPIVIPLREAAEMFDIENFDATGPNRLWGHYHEMGHAHQNGIWTDGATGEVTVNIFTVLALHEVNGYGLDAEAMRSDRVQAWRTFDAHRATGLPYESVGGPFPRLQFYALLWHEFGFDAFRETFARFRSLPEASRPRTEVEERNAFLVHFSESVGRDLCGYVDAWGIEVLTSSRERLSDLAPWMPRSAELENGEK